MLMKAKKNSNNSAIVVESQAPIPTVEVKTKKDRVGNVVDKEDALLASGASRDRVYRVLVEGLGATREQISYDSDGVKVVELVPDYDRRNKSAELLLKAYGDLKEQNIVGTNITHNKVTYQWLTKI